MFSYKHYVAVLRCREGEVGALQKLYEQDRKIITPLIELLPGKGGGFSTIIKDIAQNWGFEPFFLDLNLLNPTLRLAGGGHPFVLIGNEAKSLPVKLIPVTGLGRETSYQAAVASVVKANQHGMCVRVNSIDVSRPNFAAELLELVSHHKLDSEQTDLIIDLGVTDNSNISYSRLCSLIPNLRRWRTFTVLSGAFPKDLSKIDKDSQYELQRADWLSWQKQINAKPKLLRKPSYGDYTVQHAHYSLLKGKPNPSASIRYTAADHWVIMRGRALRGDGPGHAQYPAQALLLRGRTEFCGSTYSAGDKYITEFRIGGKKTGNTTTWISAGINHHLTFAARQVASLS